MTHIPPDGVTLQALETLQETDLEALIRTQPERAIILIDSALKHKTDLRREAWIHQAQLLELVNRTEAWRYHPDGYRSLAEWLRQPEIDISKSLASEMIALMEFAPQFHDAGYDLIQLIMDVGPTKVRKLIPTMRKADEADCLTEQVGPMLEELRGTDLGGMLEMLNPKGARLNFDPQAVYLILPDGSFEVRFPQMTYDELEFLVTKLRLRRWVDETGRSIEPPVLPEYAG